MVELQEMIYLSMFREHLHYGGRSQRHILHSQTRHCYRLGPYTWYMWMDSLQIQLSG